MQNSVTLRVIYVDPPDLVEIEARVCCENWGGLTQAYASPAALNAKACDLLEWLGRPHDEFDLEIGGGGWICLRWYPIDRASHLVCHVQLATEARSGRPEEARRLSLEMPTETSLVDNFAYQLVAVAQSCAGEAVLYGV